MYTDDQLWEYLDGTMTPSEVRALEASIEADPILRTRVQELQLLNEMLSGMEPASPSMRFSKNVMEEIAKLQSILQPKPLLSTKTFRWIAAIGALSIIISTVLATMAPTAGLNGLPADKIAQAEQGIASFIDILLNPVVMTAIAVSLAAFLLYSLDRFMNNKRQMA